MIFFVCMLLTCHKQPTEYERFLRNAEHVHTFQQETANQLVARETYEKDILCQHSTLDWFQFIIF